METAKRFLKRTLFCGAALVMAAFAAACGRADPQKDAMRQDTVQMVETANQSPETAGETLRGRVDAPETFTYEAADGLVTLSANADVSVPDVARVPVVRVGGADFSQEQIDALLSLLWQGDAMWDNEQPLTKAEVMQQIASIETNLETNPEYQDERTYFETVRLPELRAMLKTAPEETGRVSSDGKLTTESILDGTADKVVARVTKLSISGDTGRYFNVYNNADNTSVLENTRNGRLRVQKWAHLSYRSTQDGIAYFGLHTMFSGCAVSAGDQTVPAIGGVHAALSPAQAAAQAEAFFEKLGEDVSIYDMYLMNDDGQAVYVLRCVRDIQGVPCIITEGESAALYTNSDDEELPDAVWAYETITLFVDGQGVCQLDWASPHAVGETLVEDCSLLPFSDAADVCTSMLPILFDEEWGHIEDITSVQIEISRVEFGMLRVVENQSVDGGLMIPVWAFYGTETFESTSLGTKGGKFKRLMIVNAIDGSVVDPGAGV
ncbi:MAG TPA: DUF6034 family protein [Eubacteriales bacterium]|nr:DUF6034 family protein [Eubacteriales bacterium]